MVKRWAIIFALVILGVGIKISTSQAANGMVDSGKFGYGAQVFPDGAYLSESLSLAYDLQIDWLMIDIPWAEYYPEKNVTPDWTHLDQIITAKAKNGFRVLLSITTPPAWAMVDNGPDPAETSHFIQILLTRYPKSIGAIEIFPASNTMHGWGKPPDPRAYAELMKSIQINLGETGSQPILVFAGLVPQSDPVPAGNMDDIEFLDRLYQAGMGPYIKVVSLQYEQVNNNVSLKPDGRNHQVVRHYQEIRKIMLRNHQENGRIWITHFNIPDGTINSGEQSIWLKQAFEQMHSQLYLGVVIYSSLNPGSDKMRGTALILDQTNYHPFYKALSTLISENSPATQMTRRGRSKNGEMVKQLP